MERSKTRYLLTATIGLILLMIFILNASAEFRSLTVGTNSSSWSIFRQSDNLSFDYTQSVQGTVSPVDYKGRPLSPYYSGYQDVDVNDVRLRDRTSALQGSFSSEERMNLQADTTSPTTIETTFESGIYTIKFSDQWPVLLRSSKTIKYSGKEINNREFAGNNLDYAGSNLLYNKELSKETNVGMLLRTTNATVFAANETFISADFMPNKELFYNSRTYTTGIADLKYRQTGPNYDFKRGAYAMIGEGEERYSGSYNITRSIYMKSDFQYYIPEDDWLPCCFSTGNDINLTEETDYGVSAREVFDCTCDKHSAEGKIAKSTTGPE